MLKKLVLTACSLLLASHLMAAEQPRVLLTTSLGEIEIELNADKAPISVKNFLTYVDSGFYAGTQFHRVIPGFMVQGGGFDADLQQKQTQASIKNEADNGLHNVRGTLAMARTQVRDSATSQFFINHKDNAFLDHGSRDFGYAVFGKVTRGMDVVDKIAQVPTGNRAGQQNVPLQPVLIIDAKRL
ncbi:MAG: peptidylprolyl isomerase [Gammaproteobacteria bacterium]|jgi:peptidyl-prolyl cis-trans isomerase A (cyclophilin A)|uniref:Peptidyl-prolyl cis-trans isomerase n=1 Tax=Pseudomonas cuatrocienegasensis TaxID=543360 RepID=A0ABY1AZX4_9PSED|nr:MULTISPECIES: peptidylprolyl isomerase [Pseudomonas]MBU1332516.1 peptidylprolyl isomerase [Gammaproteobacteria bacterium]MBU1488157.1 peptidylprolyl isomerase [Gammaproteobacteria bacterium]MBU2066168.1 peptidylprolyl isomerase [Gammaproteobacteria bacterium]MBU2139455.1 peptidylprolyl isomerase [Gammaproteobacteria bacterium]MBU2215709.1 peptidylprolyl isomerase [Gammaproteobacteria bacterium]